MSLGGRDVYLHLFAGGVAGCAHGGDFYLLDEGRGGENVGIDFVGGVFEKAERLVVEQCGYLFVEGDVVNGMLELVAL